MLWLGSEVSTSTNTSANTTTTLYKKFYDINNETDIHLFMSLYNVG